MESSLEMLRSPSMRSRGSIFHGCTSRVVGVEELFKHSGRFAYRTPPAKQQRAVYRRWLPFMKYRRRVGFAEPESRCQWFELGCLGVDMAQTFLTAITHAISRISASRA